MADNISALAREMAMGAGQGALTGAPLAGLTGGLPAMLAGMQSGALTGAAVPLARYLMPNHADAAGLMAQGAMMGPVGLPAMLGGGLMMMGAKPTQYDQYATDSRPPG